MMEEGVKIECNDTEFNRAIDLLSAKNLRKSVRSALRTSANMIRNEVWSYALGHVSAPTNISKTQDVQVKIWKYLGGFVVYLPVRRISKGHAVSLRWMNTGTTDRYTRGKNAYRGRIEKQYFFKAATERAVPEAVQMITTALSKNIDKAVAKAKAGNQ